MGRKTVMLNPVGRRAVIAGLCAASIGCGGSQTGQQPAPPPPPSPPPPSPPPPPPPPPPPVTTIPFDFASSISPWESSYSDYTVGMEGIIRFVSGQQRVGSPLESSMGFLLGADNRSVDLFMFIFREVRNLIPGQRYRVDVDVAFATNAPPGCVGIGGAPGESVVVFAGAYHTRPERAPNATNYVSLNFDHGNQSNGSPFMTRLGNITQVTPGGPCIGTDYQRKQLSSAGIGPVVTASAGGTLWIVIGTDSGFEGRTELYYLDGKAELVPLSA